MRIGNHLMDNSGKVNYTTPKWLIKSLDFTFDLDPCGCISSPNVMAKETIYPPKDGLSEFWGNKTVFLNPPYGKNNGENDFVDKLSRHKPGGIALLLFKGDSLLWQNIILPKCSGFLLLDGRLHFNDENGFPTNGAQPQAVCLISFGFNRVLKNSNLEGYFFDKPIKQNGIKTKGNKSS